ncbi:hypothetical protein [Taibaiella koreensis]|uniref:hypothetical protein n=1 Tax=Taibaiella koreensis TaxID=1268548 RepID=UPI0013C2FCD4|nr:hypothetical protein [Taibaiella koreensis]
MNNTLLITLFSLFLLSMAPAATAQEAMAPPPARNHALQKVKEARWAFIVDRLQLDKQRAGRLQPVYNAYLAEKRVIFKGSLQQKLKDRQDLNDDEADRLMNERLENAKKLLTVKEKYKKEFLKIISPRELLSLQQAEQDFALKIQAERQKRQAGRQ